LGEGWGIFLWLILEELSVSKTYTLE
jgi:hypothetical protein